jgi:hypothetical protein
MFEGAGKFRAILLSLSSLTVLALPLGAAAQACIWEGKAPACNGECRPGYTLVLRDKEGDGKKCVTGTKAKCCLTSDIIVRGAAPLCNGKCKAGEEMMGDSEYGPDGKKCATGKAAICRLAVPY